jgi:hypothetical protein
MPPHRTRSCDSRKRRLKVQVHSGAKCAGELWIKSGRKLIREKAGLELAPRRLFVEIGTPPISILVQDQSCAELRGVISPRAAGALSRPQSGRQTPLPRIIEAQYRTPDKPVPSYLSTPAFHYHRLLTRQARSTTLSVPRTARRMASFWCHFWRHLDNESLWFSSGHASFER